MTDNILSQGEQLLNSMERSEFARAQARIATAPLDLTPREFQLLKAFGGEPLETQAYEARRLAQLEIVRQCGGSHSNSHQGGNLPPVLETKVIKPRKAPPATMDEFLQRHGDKPVTYRVLAAEWDVFLDALKQHKEKIDALTQVNKTLSDRVLELEAARAAVDHAER